MCAACEKVGFVAATGLMISASCLATLGRSEAVGRALYQSCRNLGAEASKPKGKGAYVSVGASKYLCIKMHSYIN